MVVVLCYTETAERRRCNETRSIPASPGEFTGRRVQRDMIRQYFRLAESGREKEQIRLLYRRRAALLDRLHQNQKQIDSLDYLIYQMEQSN